MQTLLLSVHVVLAILFVGPPAVAVSLFPRFVPATADVDAGPKRTGERNVAVANVLHRLTRVYGLLALAVPVLGIALAIVQQRITEVWILVAMVLTAAAAAAPVRLPWAASTTTGLRRRRRRSRLGGP